MISWGTALGLASALGYTLANVFLRASIHCDPIWVSCMKAMPTALLVSPWLIVRVLRGQAIVSSTSMLAWLVVIALVGQLAGNVLFQWSLGIVGISLAVSLTLGAMILSGVVLGPQMLRESISRRMMLAVVVLVVAIGILGLGARAANQSIVVEAATSSPSILRLASGVLAACTSGVAYCLLGVTLRAAAKDGMPQSTILATVATVGLLGLGSISASRIGISGMLGTAPDDLGVMLLGGLCNLFAFWTLTKALQLVGLVYVNSLNASQSAMAAVAGVVFFNEPPSAAMIVGVLLTAVGLLLMRNEHS